MSTTAETAVKQASDATKKATAATKKATVQASNQAATTAENLNFKRGTIIFIILMSVYFIVFFSFTISESIRDFDEGTKQNHALRVMSIVTMFVSVIVVLLIPVMCVDRFKDKKQNSTGYIYGDTYTALIVSIFAGSIGGLSLVATHSANSTYITALLKIGGGIGCGVSLLTFIFGILVLAGKPI